MLRHLLRLLRIKKEPASQLGSSLYDKQETQDMWLFVGLGNPGKKYIKTRHNVGFMAVEKIMDNHPIFSTFKSKFQGQISEGRLANQKVVLLKPETYMNESGQSVGKCAQFYKIPFEKVVVFHDELDIPASDVRIKQGGGNAGHNGLKSIQSHLGTADFWRVRIGIGRPQHSNADVSNYVLDDFSKVEMQWLEPLLDFMGDKADEIIGNEPKSYEKLIKEQLKK